jgi:WD40 repeat protein/serine/threonine protein kinase
MAHHLDHVGQRIGNYQLRRWLGGGGFGNVYLAQHLRDGSQVAIKLLHNRLSHSESLKAFINEARMVCLKHAHIVPLLDFGISREDIPFLVMEYATGGTLHDRYPSGLQVPLPLVADYAQQVGSALQYAHDQHLIHRDVKPQNMLLREDGAVLLSDFGLVAIAYSVSSQEAHQRMGGGTITYMAPEQIQGQVKAASDQYSLGVVVYEWITGRCPFEGTTTEVGTQHMMRPPPSLRAQVPTLSRAVEEVVLKALAKEPEERFATVQDFTVTLEQVIRETSAAPDAHQISSVDNNEPVSSSYTSLTLVPSPQPLPVRKPRVDWGDALTVPSFYGREQEQVQLTQWVIQDHCRVASVVGMGGIGKSALVINVAHQLSEGKMSLTNPFEVVIVRSLRDAPSCEALLDGCLQVLSPQPLNAMPVTLERRISLLLSCLREVRALIVLDNLEDLLSAGDTRGQFRPGFEGYGRLLRRVAETEHQSCVLLTSREKPAELRLLAGRYSSVRTLRLTGLGTSACKQLLEEKELVGTEEDMERLIEIYVGNPLALKIVARTIVDLFGGEIDLFLSSGIVVFGSITDLLEEQFARLSALEQSVLCWLAIMREPVTLDELSALLVTRESRVQILEAVDAGYRRSLIERGKRAGTFTLQSVVLEYVTAFLVTKACQEIKQRHLDRLIQYGFSQATAREYVRQTQERLLLSPLLRKLRSVYLGQVNGTEQELQRAAGSSPAPTASVEEQLLGLLDDVRREPDDAQGYGPANLIALLRLLRGNLNSLDLSRLCIRGMYVQGTEMQDTKLSGALICDCVWTSAVSATWTIAMSMDGKWWAAGGNQGQVRVWAGIQSPTLHLVWQAHTDLVYALAFSPDGRLLASGSTDGTVKLWDVDSGALLWTGYQYHPLSLAFSPDGQLLASGGIDATVRLWDPKSGENLHTLTHPSHVWALAWGPDGSVLAGGGKDGEIRLWKRQEEAVSPFALWLSMQATNWVAALSFAPDGRTLASTSWRDQTVKLWAVANGQLLQTLQGYTDNSRCVAWSPDGRTLAYCNPDKGIWLWDVEEGRIRSVLHGHSADVHGMVFTPDGSRLLSGSADGTLRVWDVENYQCVSVAAGYVVSLWDLDWSPDGTHLVSGGMDGRVTLWDIDGARPPRVLYRHSWIVEGVGWSPDGRYLSSCGLDGVLCLWDPTTDTLVHRFENSKMVLLGMAWSPDGSELAYGTYGQGIQVWDATTRSIRFVGQTHPKGVWCVTWSPDGTRLAGGDDDGGVYVWENRESAGQAQDGDPLSLSGHQGSRIMGLAWSPDGKYLASGSGNSSSGELFLWDVETAVRIRTFEGHPGMIYALAWYPRRDGDGTDPSRDQLISGGSDGMLRWWDVESGACVSTQEAHQGIIRSLKVSPDGKLLASCGEDGAIMTWNLTSHAHLRTLRRDRPYERLNITGIRGLNEAEIASLQALGAIDETTP